MLLRTFRKLRKQKVTRIHMNLFASMILQSLVRLVIYIDQLVVREHGFTVGARGDGGGGTRGIDNTVGLFRMAQGSSLERKKFFNQISVSSSFARTMKIGIFFKKNHDFHLF